jgi:2-amino-4-hydroxy-6-hydroxymethyldihydropteridine diphosphokinase
LTSTVYIALGSNLGDRSGNLAAARHAIASMKGTSIIAESSIEETAPIGIVDQPSFLNQMLAVETSLAPDELLTELHAIEHACGRERRERWGPRTLDLDIVRFGDLTVSTDKLSIPHPEFQNRDFWQREMDELRKVMSK